jgi:hypothetical protein
MPARLAPVKDIPAILPHRRRIESSNSFRFDIVHREDFKSARARWQRISLPRVEMPSGSAGKPAMQVPRQPLTAAEQIKGYPATVRRFDSLGPPSRGWRSCYREVEAKAPTRAEMAKSCFTVHRTGTPVAQEPISPALSGEVRADGVDRNPPALGMSTFADAFGHLSTGGEGSGQSVRGGPRQSRARTWRIPAPQ